jgi:hypothetical protein
LIDGRLADFPAIVAGDAEAVKMGVEAGIEVS